MARKTKPKIRSPSHVPGGARLGVTHISHKRLCQAPLAPRSLTCERPGLDAEAEPGAPRRSLPFRERRCVLFCQFAKAGSPIR
jgi:hypothetical protein